MTTALELSKNTIHRLYTGIGFNYISSLVKITPKCLSSQCLKYTVINNDFISYICTVSGGEHVFGLIYVNLH